MPATTIVNIPGATTTLFNDEMKAEEMELKIINSYVEMLRASKVVRKNSGSNSGLMPFPPFQG